MKKLNIYLIENDRKNGKRFSKKLQEQLNCVVKTFINGEACLAELKNEEGNPDLILADHYLGRQRQKEIGSEYFLQTLKLDYSAIPVMEFSADRGVDMVIQMVQQGALDLIENSTNIFEKIAATFTRGINNILAVYNLVKEQITISKILAFLVFFNASLFVLFYATSTHLPYLLTIATGILMTAMYQLRALVRKQKSSKAAAATVIQH